ncbi:PREDICTED: inversin-A-like isoform X2 [Amphimedon queenslandica]|uniref:cGMP-dependent protein kinase interacting domain-containing protein n=1 Tax=Amphimedon queenslandica TaxID=400682 RepID=A0AAN0JP06_AMPQE|nr:PREDICTED: inversin-A-like isoform X2 [Amphimedon queenslandica]|eukprot:XP_019858749.1 PREDICTED: inversin-A-like isoform X2 [Amphimedon queenslandica]
MVIIMDVGGLVTIVTIRRNTCTMFCGSVNEDSSVFSSPTAFIREIIQKGIHGEKQLSVGLTLCHTLLENGGQSNGSLLSAVTSNERISGIKSILAKKEIDINEASGDTGVTSLMISCLLGRDDVVKLLLKHGADTGLTDREQLNSFHYSIWGMNIKCVKALLSLPLVSSKDQYGRSAPMIAAHKGNIPIFQLLIKKGANLYDKDNGNRTVMHWAATSGNLSFLEMLYKRYIPDISEWSCTDEDGATPLHYSLIGSNTQILQFLISKGCNPIPPDTAKTLSVIHWSCALGLTDPLHCILTTSNNTNSANSNIDELVMCPSSVGEPLHVAASVGSMELSQLLVERGNDVVNNRDPSSGMTPLHCSSAHGHLNTLRLLLTNNAEANGLNHNNGQSGLHYASASGHGEVLKELLKNGAERDKPSSSSDSPIHLAASKGHKNILEILISDGTSIDIVRASDGRTPLHLSSLAGHSVAVQYLLDKGADCNRKDTTHGYTPLDLALLNGHSSVGDSLISSGGCTGAGRIHESATKIQQCWRRYVIKRREFVTRDWAARKIQYQYRSWSDKKRAKRVRRLREKRRNEAALIIQQNWLTYISIKRKMEQSYLALKTKLNYEYITTQLVLAQLEQHSKSINLPPSVTSNPTSTTNDTKHTPHSRCPTAGHILKLSSIGNETPRKPLLRPLPVVRTVSEQTDSANRLGILKSSKLQTRTHTSDPHSTSNRESQHVVQFVDEGQGYSSLSKSVSSPLFPSVSSTGGVLPSEGTKINSSESFDVDRLPALKKPVTGSSQKQTQIGIGGSTRQDSLSSGKRIKKDSSLSLPAVNGSNAVKKSNPKRQKTEHGRSSKSQKSKISPERESLLLNHAERYSRLHQVMELLQEAKEKQKSSSVDDGNKADYRELKIQIQSTLEEAVRLRAETETLSGKISIKE